ncbi:MAG: hypothetical protein BRC41_08200 [Cyanobacteria bacterium QH_9_48_43]|nr:MAG: hypothetical protein BRC41_08200 [Cyanobacteria bacterium QH_9_48_43]
MVTASSFQNTFSEFSNLESAKVTSFLEQAKLENRGFSGLFGEARDYAIKLYTAHLLKLDERMEKGNLGESGVVEKVSSNNDSISFATAGEGHELTTTVYGQRLDDFLMAYYKGSFIL